MVIDVLGMIVYIVVLYLYINFNLNIRLSAILMGAVPLVFKAIYKGIAAASYGGSFFLALSPSDIVIFIAEILSSLVILTYLQRSDEDTHGWLFIALFGAVVSYVLIPSMILCLLCRRRTKRTVLCRKLASNYTYRGDSSRVPHYILAIA